MDGNFGTIWFNISAAYILAKYNQTNYQNAENVFSGYWIMCISYQMADAGIFDERRNGRSDT